jgi:hypothetical protein
MFPIVFICVSLFEHLSSSFKNEKDGNPIGFFPNGSGGNRAILKKQRAGSSLEARCIARRS